MLSPEHKYHLAGIERANSGKEFVRELYLRLGVYLFVDKIEITEKRILNSKLILIVCGLMVCRPHTTLGRADQDQLNGI